MRSTELDYQQKETLILCTQKMNINIDGISSTIRQTLVSNIYIGSNGNDNFLYNLDEQKVIGRRYSTIEDFFIYEKDEKEHYYAKVVDVIDIKNVNDSTAELSFFIDEDNNIVTPVHCSLDSHNKFITVNDDFAYNELIFFTKIRLVEEVAKTKEDEATQLRLSSKHN